MTAATDQHDVDPNAEYRALRPVARMSSTTHPHVFYWLAASEAVLFTVLGAILVSRSVISGLVVLGIGLLGSAVTAWPAHWSERHRDEARNAVRVQRDRRNRLAQRHPAYFVVIVPLIAAVDATARWNRGNHHHTVLGWIIPAVIGLAFGLTLGVVLIYRARHAQRGEWGRPTHT
jgi:hypothetical protein